MSAVRTPNHKLSEFLRYLVQHSEEQNGDRLPALAELSKELGISVASLREQLEVARAMGLVEVRPRTGIRRLPYTFRPAVQQSLAYAMALHDEHFLHYADLRKHVEAAYWFEAVSCLQPQDHEHLAQLVRAAFEKLNRQPVQIPHEEHRDLHLSVYKRLGNLFVTGILETYWELYEAAGLDIFTDYLYLQRVWQYHEKMVEAIRKGNFEEGFRALTEHMDLLNTRPKPVSRHKFE